MRRPLALAVLLLAGSAAAQNALQISSVALDPPTLHTLGVQVLIAGDANRDARIELRWRVAGTETWNEGPPLFRVLTAPLLDPKPPEQFAGSVFDLEPGTDYEVELHAVDVDGAVDEIRTVAASTRPVPRAEPEAPRAVAVSNATELTAALAAAQAGDVITLAEGTYVGTFVLAQSGTQTNPIVVRGASQTATILETPGEGANGFEIRGSFIHLERLTVQHTTSGVRLYDAHQGNVVRRLRILDVVHGIETRGVQQSLYICDNVIEGRLRWPSMITDPNWTDHWDDRGVNIEGSGHVVCHNRMLGFGDPMINKHRDSRAYDFYGNDIYDTIDGTELDEGQGNVRCFRNRWTNVYAGISIQPARGGPTYVLRNVLYNVSDEQVKLKSLGGTDLPSGAVVLHNTFVSPKAALNLQAPILQSNSVFANNLFVGPSALDDAVVDWTAQIDRVTFDYNGYYPDGQFWFGRNPSNNAPYTYSSFAAAQAGGLFEGHGMLLEGSPFLSGAVGPPGDGTTPMTPEDFSLASGSGPIDRGERRVGINDGFSGSAPDLGALEQGCAAPIYGPRPEGGEALTSRINCGSGSAGGTGSGGSDGGGESTRWVRGYSCESVGGGSWVGWVAVVMFARLRRRVAPCGRGPR